MDIVNIFFLLFLLLIFFSLFIYMPFYAYLIKKHHPPFFDKYFRNSIFYAYIPIIGAQISFFVKKLYLQPYRTWGNTQERIYPPNKWVVFHGKILTWLYGYTTIAWLVLLIVLSVHIYFSSH